MNTQKRWNGINYGIADFESGAVTSSSLMTYNATSSLHLQENNNAPYFIDTIERTIRDINSTERIRYVPAVTNTQATSLPLDEAIRIPTEKNNVHASAKVSSKILSVDKEKTPSNSIPGTVYSCQTLSPTKAID